MSLSLCGNHINEIKALAKGTAEATSKIRITIEKNYNQTGNTVAEISKIAAVIEDVNDIVTIIVTVVEEQSITTNEIVGNVARSRRASVKLMKMWPIAAKWR